ncbi:hypothetical protein JTB14_036626 [Gonioctena quinquepunctata]|nr:hypothetical protein JTB14_036626 [Gonioctena quinquepunctata]
MRQERKRRKLLGDGNVLSNVYDTKLAEVINTIHFQSETCLQNNTSKVADYINTVHVQSSVNRRNNTVSTVKLPRGKQRVNPIVSTVKRPRGRQRVNPIGLIRLYLIKYDLNYRLLAPADLTNNVLESASADFAIKLHYFSRLPISFQTGALGDPEDRTPKGGRSYRGSWIYIQ